MPTPGQSKPTRLTGLVPGPHRAALQQRICPSPCHLLAALAAHQQPAYGRLALISHTILTTHSQLHALGKSSHNISCISVLSAPVSLALLCLHCHTCVLLPVSLLAPSRLPVICEYTPCLSILSISFISTVERFPAVLIRSPFGLDRDLAPAQTSLQAAGGSLQQHYFPEASSALGGSLLTHAASSGDPHPRQHWPQLNQRGHNPFGLPPPHHSSAQPTGLHLGLNQGAQPPANSLFHASQDSQPRSSMFDRAQPAHEHDEFLIGQLEQHYLTQLQSSGSPQDVSSEGVVNTHGAAGGIPLRGGSWESGHMNRQAPFLPNPLGFMNAEQQQLLQHQQRHFSSNNPSSSVVYDVAEYEPISQGGMNLDQLSALMQAERSQALPALQSQQPLSFAQSYLTSLRMISPFSSAVSAPPVASNSYPLHGELFQNQGNVYSSWERMQRPVQSMQHSLEHAQPSTAEAQAAQGRGLLQYCEPSLQDDQDLLFQRHHES